MKSFFTGLAFILPVTLSAQAQSDSLNVLMIVVDDLNDWVGALKGHPDALTPNIDRLAERGMLFTNAYASSPLCGPSRAALLSGIRASTSGLHDNKGLYAENPVLKTVENIPQFLKRNGYRTFASGKVFHEYQPQFWDMSIPNNSRMYQAGQPKKHGYSVPGIFDFGPLDIPTEQMDDYKMTQFAIDRLSEKHEKPFFIACGIYLPHLPWYAPEEYFKPFSPENISIPLINPDDLNDLSAEAVKITNPAYYKQVAIHGPEFHKLAVRSYLASIHFADAMVGRILDALDKSIYRNNTIIILLGDNGNHLGEKNKWHKDDLWDESTHVPLIIHVPGINQKQKSCDRMVSLLDIYPTLANLLNIPPPSHLEGRSLVKLLKKPESVWKHAVISNRRPGQFSVRTDKWCYIRYQNGTKELYDRKKDPNEWKNLSDIKKYRAVKKGLKKNLR